MMHTFRGSADVQSLQAQPLRHSEAQHYPTSYARQQLPLQQELVTRPSYYPRSDQQWQACQGGFRAAEVVAAQQQLMLLQQQQQQHRSSRGGVQEQFSSRQDSWQPCLAGDLNRAPDAGKGVLCTRPGHVHSHAASSAGDAAAAAVAVGGILQPWRPELGPCGSSGSGAVGVGVVGGAAGCMPPEGGMLGQDCLSAPPAAGSRTLDEMVNKEGKGGGRGARLWGLVQGDSSQSIKSRVDKGALGLGGSYMSNSSNSEDSSGTDTGAVLGEPCSREGSLVLEQGAASGRGGNSSASGFGSDSGEGALRGISSAGWMGFEEVRRGLQSFRFGRDLQEHEPTAAAGVGMLPHVLASSHCQNQQVRPGGVRTSRGRDPGVDCSTTGLVEKDSYGGRRDDGRDWRGEPDQHGGRKQHDTRTLLVDVHAPKAAATTSAGAGRDAGAGYGSACSLEQQQPWQAYGFDVHNSSSGPSESTQVACKPAGLLATAAAVANLSEQLCQPSTSGPLTRHSQSSSKQQTTLGHYAVDGTAPSEFYHPCIGLHVPRQHRSSYSRKPSANKCLRRSRKGRKATHMAATGAAGREHCKWVEAKPKGMGDCEELLGGCSNDEVGYWAGEGSSGVGGAGSYVSHTAAGVNGSGMEGNGGEAQEEDLAALKAARQEALLDAVAQMLSELQRDQEGEAYKVEMAQKQQRKMDGEGGGLMTVHATAGPADPRGRALTAGAFAPGAPTAIAAAAPTSATSSSASVAGPLVTPQASIGAEYKEHVEAAAAAATMSSGAAGRGCLGFHPAVPSYTPAAVGAAAAAGDGGSYAPNGAFAAAACFAAGGHATPEPLKLDATSEAYVAKTGTLLSPCLSTKSSNVVCSQKSSSSSSLHGSMVLHKTLTEMDIVCAADPLGIMLPSQATMQNAWIMSEASSNTTSEGGCTTISKSFTVVPAEVMDAIDPIVPTAAAAAPKGVGGAVADPPKVAVSYTCSITCSSNRRFAYLTGLGGYLQSSHAQPGDQLLLEVSAGDLGKAVLADGQDPAMESPEGAAAGGCMAAEGVVKMDEGMRGGLMGAHTFCIRLLRSNVAVGSC